MAASFYQNFKLGILGGGQLGRMLIQSGIDLNVQFAVLDPDADAPCCSFSGLHVGKLTDYDTVMKFGGSCDLITIEIENVNTAALKELAARGKNVFPQPEIIELIQDKREQKKFYARHGIPTATFVLTENRSDVEANRSLLPAVQKIGREGDDGRGGQILRTGNGLPPSLDFPGLIESPIDFAKEISVIVAREADGRAASYSAAG